MKKSKILHLLVNPVFVIVFLFLFFCVVAAHLDISYDESLWTYIGNLWNNKGIPPYIGAAENKTPGIFILYAISDFLASGNIFFVRGIGILAILFTSIFLYLICKKVYNKATGIICMYMFGLVVCWEIMDGFAFAQTETFMIFFSTMAFYFIICSQHKNNRNKWLLLSGLSVGVAIAFKQIALTTAVALFLAFLVYNSKSLLLYKLKGILIIGFGICVSTILSYSVLYFYGVSFYDYIDGAWLILLNPGSKITGQGAHFSNFINVFFFSRFVLFYPLLFLFFWKKDIIKNKYKIVLITWLVLDFVGVNASGYYYGHQIKQMLPSFSIIVSSAIYYLINKKYYVKREDFNNKVAIVIILLGVFCFPYKQIYKNLKLVLQYDNKSSVPHVEIANWVKKNSNLDDYIYIVGGEPNLIRALSIAERTSSSKYFHSIFLTGNSERDILMTDLKLKPPVYILKDKIIQKEIFDKYGDQFKGFMAENYVLIKDMYNVEIFKRN